MIDVGLLFRLVAHEVTTYYRLSWRWISIVATFFLTVAIFMAPTLGTLLAISQYYQILLSGAIFVSPSFYPIGVLPAFPLYPAFLNPVTYGLGLVRAGIHIGTFNSIDLLALLFSSAFLVLVAYRGYLRRVDQIVMG